MKAPIGALVSIYYDGFGCVGFGDYLRTETGRLYKVVGVRVQGRGLHRRRKHIKAIVVSGDTKIEAGVLVHSLVWYRRTRKSR